MPSLTRKARATFWVGVILVLLGASMPIVTVAGKGLEPFQLFARASSGWEYPTGWGTPDAYEVVTHLT